MLTNELMAIAFIFDSGKIDNSFYGDVVFENIISGREVVSNSHKIVFSAGDIFGRSIYDDIRPFLIHDEACTIDPNERRFVGVLYAVLLEDVQLKIATSIDARLKESFPAFLGMTSIDIESTDTRKQFWKSLIRSYSIEDEIVTSFGTESEGSFGYVKTAEKFGFRIKYDDFPDETDCNKGDYLFSTRQSTFIQSLKQLELLSGQNDSDRGLSEMNFALVKEIEIAGVQIWKAIEDINLVLIPSKTEHHTVTDYIFTSLYQASQGVERLLKIAIELILYGNTDTTEKQNAEKLLLGHNHPALADFIENREESFALNTNCRNLLSVLSNFYRQARYSRFRYNENQTLELELIQSLGREIDDEGFSEKVKHIYGKTLGQVSQSLYDLIETISSRLGIYAYELNTESVANFSLCSYFGRDLYETLKRAEQAKREFLWYAMQRKIIPKYADLVTSFPPLSFEDYGFSNEFLKNLIVSGYSPNLLLDYVSNEYDELVEQDKELWKERMEIIELLFSNHYTILDDEEDEDSHEQD